MFPPLRLGSHVLLQRIPLGILGGPRIGIVPALLHRRHVGRHARRADNDIARERQGDADRNDRRGIRAGPRASNPRSLARGGYMGMRRFRVARGRIVRRDDTYMDLRIPRRSEDAFCSNGSPVGRSRIDAPPLRGGEIRPDRRHGDRPGAPRRRDMADIRHGYGESGRSEQGIAASFPGAPDRSSRYPAAALLFLIVLARAAAKQDGGRRLGEPRRAGAIPRILVRIPSLARNWPKAPCPRPAIHDYPASVDRLRFDDTAFRGGVRIIGPRRGGFGRQCIPVHADIRNLA